MMHGWRCMEDTALLYSSMVEPHTFPTIHLQIRDTHHSHDKMATTQLEPAGIQYQLAIPLPKSISTNIHIHLTIESHHVLLFLTSRAPESPPGSAQLGSFVYALKSVSRVVYRDILGIINNGRQPSPPRYLPRSTFAKTPSRPQR
jgi:hypothetical protein